MKLSFLSVLLFPLTALALEPRLLGNIEMQVRSRSSSLPDNVLVGLMSVTVVFLDSHFTEYFESTDKVFERVSLSVESFQFEEEGSGHLAQITFSGLALFNQTSPAASQDEVSHVISQVFQKKNQDFLRNVMESSDPFLRDVSYAIVKVDGDVLANNQATTSTVDPPFAAWMIALLAAGCGFILVLSMCILCICCTPVNEAPHVEIKASKSSRTSKRTDDDESSANHSGRSPSPIKSITSQDSSVFTFNPQSCKSEVDAKTFGSFLTNNTAAELDLEAWQKGSTVQSNQVPFGHDISAIENKKDLSLIEEGDEDSTPTKNHEVVQRYLSPNALEDMERGHRMARKASMRNKYMKKQQSLNKSAADVINDLKDLSVQIDHYRHR